MKDLPQYTAQGGMLYVFALDGRGRPGAPAAGGEPAQ
jgi:hypothetical protein